MIYNDKMERDWILELLMRMKLTPELHCNPTEYMHSYTHLEVASKFVWLVRRYRERVRDEAVGRRAGSMFKNCEGVVERGLHISKRGIG